MTSWDEQTDVLIVGSGTAGLSAAIEARNAGAHVIVIEKMKVTGGNTRISDGGLAAPGNPLQKKQNIRDSAELFYQDMLRAGLGLNHPHLARIVADRAEEAIRWTINDLGVKYLDRLDRFGGHSVARCITTRSHSGADLIKAQLAKLEQLGVTVRTQSMLTGFIVGSDAGVMGARVTWGYRFGSEDSGTRQSIRVKRAVVLATGGFGNDIPFRTLQNPSLNDAIGSTNHRGATAEGLIAALNVNAAPVHLSWIQLGPWGCADEKGYGRGASFASYSVYPAGILVDPATGMRIVNEWADRRRRCDAILTAGHICVGLVDAKGAQIALESLKHCLTKGVVNTFDSLSHLASAYDIPANQLEDTVGRYNQRVSNGEVDEFGKRLEDAHPISTPPRITPSEYGPKSIILPGEWALTLMHRLSICTAAQFPAFLPPAKSAGVSTAPAAWAAPH